MIKLTINGRDVEVQPGTSIMQACEGLGIQIPHFCYHDKLSAPANCRMCMVEVEKMPKPVPSCAQPCAEGMVVKTETPAVWAARKSVMESLLINHPLDCPVCDQGGECDLQDQAMAYGQDRSRFHEEKRLVSNKELGPLVKTVMTRCIACTRCIRFLDEIAGTPELCKINRGEKTEITNLNGKPLTSELSGNLIDVCPVGALTAKPYAFQGRSWEMTHTPSIDLSDALGSAIRIDTREGRVMRVAPRRNDAINESWISDKARFSFDGLFAKRLDQPFVRVDGHLKPASWDEAFEAIAQRLSRVAPEQVAAFAGDQADAESMFALKSLMHAIDSPHMDCRQDGALYDVSQRAAYIMNTPIVDIEKVDALLMVGVNPRREAAMLNARLRKAWRYGGLSVGMIGRKADLAFGYDHISNKPQALIEIAEGKGDFAKHLAKAKNPMIMVGASAFARADGLVIQHLAYNIAATYDMQRGDWNGFNVLQTAASRVGGLDMGFLPQSYGWNTREIMGAASVGQIDTLFLLGADEMDMQVFGSSFVVYIGSHGDKGAERADVILPSPAVMEKSGLYANAEGRVQKAMRATMPIGHALSEVEIILALADCLGKRLPFADQESALIHLQKEVPVFASLDVLPSESLSEPVGEPGKLFAHGFDDAIENFYMTDPLCRASATMKKCVAEIMPYQRPEEVA